MHPLNTFLTSLMSQENIDVYLVLIILFSFGLMETLAGFLSHSNRSAGDWTQEIVSFLILSTGIKPAIVAAVYFLGNALFPNGGLFLSEVSFLPLFFGYILVDDFLQYWYHRTAHTHPFLWKLHRSHHQAEEMGYFVAYRNAMLYYVMMPNIWWVGMVVFAGGAKAVALGLVIKQLIIISSHSRLQWDRPFYRYALLRPVIALLERIIITPAFHHAHHGTSVVDAAANPNKNFGNMFSLWDQLFGTATYVKRYPLAYGLPTKTNDHWTAAYFYPFVTSKDKNSAWHKDHQFVETATNTPLTVTLTKGETYLWCACGKSQNQPFCDGSHHGTHQTPLKFTAKRTGTVRLCNCKLTQTAPFCDDTHLNG